MSQDREGSGIKVARQERESRALAERLGWTVADVFTDNDVSASTGARRPGYEALVDLMRTGTIGGVIAWHTDRLHRRPTELEDYLAVAEPRGIITHTVEAGPLDLATPSGRAVARTLAAWARFEVEHKASRTIAGMREAALAGKWLGGKEPFGWRKVDGENRLAIVADEADAIRWGADALLRGVSLRHIAHEWTARGYTGRLGADFEVQHVRQILLRPRNAGVLTYRGEEVGTLPDAILEESTWRAIVAMLNAPDRPNVGSVNKLRHLLSGLARCYCGNVVNVAHIKARDGGTFLTYRCAPRGRKPLPEGARHVAKRAEYVDALVESVVLARLSAPDAAAVLTRPDDDDGPALHLEADRLRKRLADLATAYADGAVTLAQLTTATAKLTAELERIEGAMARSKAVPPLAVELLTADDIEACWDGAGLAEKRLVVDALMSVTLLPSDKMKPREFDPESVAIEWRRA